MTPELALLGIKALIRLGQQTDKAVLDYAVDKPAPLGDVQVFELTDPRDLLTKFLSLPRYKHLTQAPPYNKVWNTTLLGGAGIGNDWDKVSPDDQTSMYLTAVDAARGDGEALAALGYDKADAKAKGKDPGTQLAADALAGQVLIEQWKPDKKPASPFARIALAIVEAGLDYVAADPSIFKVGTSGEKVLSALAIALAKPLTAKLDAATLGTKTELVNGLMTAFLGAGLQTLKEHSADLISDQQLATLLGNVLDPVVTAANNGDVLFQDQLQHILDALGGPAAQAAMKAIAANPGAYLGKNFDSAKAAGALVSALLVESAKNQDVSVAFGQAGALKLLNAALQVVADKPGLFIKTGDKPDAVASLLTDLAASLATQLKTPVLNLIGDQQVDGSALATGIAAAAIEVFGRRADALIGGQGDPWHDVARKAAAAVLGNLATAINAPAGTALKQALSQDKLVELGRIVIEGIAANPGMTGASDAKAREIISAVATAIDAATKDKKQFLLTADDWLDVARSMVKEVAAVPGLIAGKDAGLQAVVTALANVIAGDKNSVMAGADIKTVIQTLLTEVVSHPAMLAGLKDDVQRVTLAVAKAMAADSNLLLSGPDWAEILKAALSEASANPARLFGLNYNDGNQALAADIIGLVLKSIPTLPAAGGTTGLILKGDVLREATTIILRYVSGAPDLAKKYEPLLETAVKQISIFVGDNPGNYGSKEWLRLIRVLAGDILNGKYDTQLAALLSTPAGVVTLIPATKDADAMLARAA